MFVGKQRLGDRAADIEGQAVFRQAVEAIDAFDAIHLADTGVVPRLRRIGLHERQVGQFSAHRLLTIRVARHELAAIGHQRHHAVLAEAVMESGKDIRADRYHQHPVEGIGGEDRAGELDRPLARHLAEQRFADEQVIILPRMHAEMFALAKEHPLLRRPEIGESQPAVLVDDGNLESDVGHVALAMADDLAEALGVAIPARAQVEQDLVQPLDQGARIFGCRLRLEYRAQPGLAQIGTLPAIEFVGHGQPDDGEAGGKQEGKDRLQ